MVSPLALSVLVTLAGLLWEDLMVVTPQVERALARLTAEEQQARTRRISRAVDMDIKHVYLSKDQQVRANEHTLCLKASM